jgi:hypothetical protein
MFSPGLKRKLRKILYYSDIKLFFCILITSLKISYRVSILSCRNLLLLIKLKKNKIEKINMEKIINYVHFFLRLRKKLGLKDTCLTYSLLLCRILRKSGIDAKINFASKRDTLLKEGFPFSGHCWVTLNEKDTSGEWEIIFRYP